MIMNSYMNKSYELIEIIEKSKPLSKCDAHGPLIKIKKPEIVFYVLQ